MRDLREAETESSAPGCEARESGRELALGCAFCRPDSGAPLCMDPGAASATMTSRPGGEHLHLVSDEESAASTVHGAAFTHLPVGALIVRFVGESRYDDEAWVLEDANIVAERILRSQLTAVRGEALLTALPMARDGGLLTVINSVRQSGRPNNLGDVPIGVSSEPVGFFSIRVVPLGDELVMVLFEDVSRAVDAEARVAWRVRELERATADMENFARLASHDLKSPLRAISHLSEWIREDIGEAVSDNAREMFDLIDTRVCRMDALVDGLLSYSRIGRLEEPLSKVCTQSLVRDLVRELNAPPSFRFEVSSALPTIVTREGVLREVLRQLLDNAVRHHDQPGGVITVDCEQVRDELFFTVSDDGPGVDRMFADKVFQVFQTLHSRDQRESAGLGLAIVRRLLDAYGGQIDFHANNPRGCVFGFTWRAETA
ncbi:ATP-binding protein [bacterium]|nr:ATP-binding protein [bacterium]